MATNQSFVRVWARHAAKVAAFLAGFDPLEVWKTYQDFEATLELLAELIQLAEDEAKPLLEERERRRGT